MGQGFSKGFFKPRNPKKYVPGRNKEQIIFRSSWEHDFCKFLDGNTRVLRWSSEPFSIPYIKPTDKKTHKYYPDFWFEYVDRNGEIIQEVIEIKPSTQMRQPNPVGKKPKQQLYESITYAINIAKWKAATEFCNKYNMKFRLINENTQFR
jgi:hypothetical protein